MTSFYEMFHTQLIHLCFHSNELGNVHIIRFAMLNEYNQNFLLKLCVTVIIFKRILFFLLMDQKPKCMVRKYCMLF